MTSLRYTFELFQRVLPSPLSTDDGLLSRLSNIAEFKREAVRLVTEHHYGMPRVRKRGLT